MTRDDIVRMAKEAGIEQVMRLHGGGSVVLPTPILERFAALVRAQVIEEAAVRSAIHSQYPITTDYDKGYDAGRRNAAAAIRGMKSEPGHSVSSVAEASTAPLPEGAA